MVVPGMMKPLGSLMDLADSELLHIASLLERPVEGARHVPPEAQFTRPSTELVNLSSVCTRARRLLSPLVFHSIVLGEAERTSKYHKRLKQLSRMAGVLCLVRHVLMLDVHRRAIKALEFAMRSMINLRYYTHAASVPILLPVAQLLRNHFSVFAGVHLQRFAAESLPSLVCNRVGKYQLSGLLQLKVISVQTLADKPALRDLRSAAPITVATKRRVGCCGRVIDGPTQQEHTEALVDGLARLILASKEILESFELERGGYLTDVKVVERIFGRMLELSGGKEYPILLQLRRLSIRKTDCDSAAVQHLLATSPRLTHVCFAECLPKAMDWPSVPLKYLQSIHYLFVMDLSVAHTVKGFIDGSLDLKELQLQGMHAKETKELFHRRPPYDTIRVLNLAFAGGALTHQNLLTICGACPHVVDLTLTALRWKCSWSQLVKLLAIGMTELEMLDTDIPAVARSAGTISSGGGDGIRSRSAGDFKLLNTIAGHLSDEEVLEMINVDISATRPFYLEKVVELASGYPALRRVVLRPTAEVVWTFLVSRDADGEVELDDQPVVTLMK